ncbi:EXS family-domain-containing protein [Mycena leptocephala]|nr:EXS family-domain-containing protein [Mycena leptocephala]
METSAEAPVDSIAVDVSSGLKTDDDRIETGPCPDHLDPKEYQHARRKLKKAVLEHYRGLEMLHNYRILNIYGFRRVLNKFEKATKIPAQRAYMEEKVEKCTFYSDETLRNMMDEMQNIFATSFAAGDRTKAITRLRGGPEYKSHHNSTFCSGLAIGSAAAALGLGIAHRKHPDRDPGMGRITVYLWGLGGASAFCTPRRLKPLELDLRTRLDHREYFQTPAVLLAALCYAFWLSFARIGAPHVSPTIWPLVWLAFAGVVMFDPFPVLFKPSRYWLIRNVGKLLKSGTRRVEFTDFWMGDQFCSLVFTLSNLTLIGCVYSQGFDAEWRKCGNASRLWPLAFVLAVLPFLVRFIQSIRRYVDSKLTTHLINAGKYGAGIVNYLVYFIWRQSLCAQHPQYFIFIPGGHYDSTFALWCLFNSLYTTYALIWDFLMDWSILRPHSRHFLLRQELIYTNHILMYYFAIATNTLIRFLWILYIPPKGPDVMLRSFIVGLLEITIKTGWRMNIWGMLISTG